jgi:hypothetical protein
VGGPFLPFLEQLRNNCEPLLTVFRPPNAMRRRLKHIREMTAEAAMNPWKSALNSKQILEIRGAGKPASLRDYRLRL